MTIKPLAYAAVAADGSESVYVASLKEQAEACCRENGWFLLPLYAAPPTWQEEVAAVEAAFEKSGVQPTWPDDEAGNVGPMAEAMADEIKRLRLADDEREAILYCISCAQDYRDTLDCCHRRDRYDRATQLIRMAMRFALSNVGPAPVERQRSASVADVGGAGLTLTDAEREAVQRAMASIADTLDYASQQAAADYATLRGLLERTSGAHATPAQGSVQSLGSVQGWIPVTESNPCHGDAVWVYDGKDVFMGEWWGQSGFQSYGSSCDREGLNSETLLGVTHWMEIDEPEPPG